MRSAEQVRWDFVQQWLSKAERDLEAARVLLQSGMEDYENVGFHAQQAAEKVVKAFLVRHQVEFPKSHYLDRLRGLVAQVDQGLASRLTPADALTPYGVEFRYPGALGKVSQDQGKEALQVAEQTQKLILESLEPYLDAGRPEAEADT
jgi:HEPN domain-containing protein